MAKHRRQIKNVSVKEKKENSIYEKPTIFNERDLQSKERFKS